MYIYTSTVNNACFWTETDTIKSLFCCFCLARCHPEEVHIAFGNKVSDVVVIWSTVGNCSTSVEYGPGPWNLSLTTSGETKLFIETNPSGKHYLHRVVVKVSNFTIYIYTMNSDKFKPLVNTFIKFILLSQDLDNSLTYFYRPISNGISSGPFYFKTPPSGNVRNSFLWKVQQQKTTTQWQLLINLSQIR